ncbi:hypothetical protein HOK68_05330 [Candidatus Woesearchaeota archaeon]|jgi:hypothetical protein|nr:hypothetical protein [Candidatus Woesearchaeota archaeon]MBT4387621.1 hypothetical protein [Candidatus Woesearchaeota archaeon]MBT4596016.1 hypothetical protein [Candidatus Woesearchaeota archaeon]MBT5740723.1 hypothetical protein [Candidatus Woesearchaeota archaeon]MBT6506172.1 hypothetical protein [Candidatus Woesearchaeota archaeon]
MGGVNKLIYRSIGIIILIGILFLINYLIKSGIEKFDPCQSAVDFKITNKYQEQVGDNIMFNITIKNEGIAIGNFAYQVVNEDEFGVGLADINQSLEVDMIKSFSYSFSKSVLKNKPIYKIQILPVLKSQLKCTKKKKIIYFED